MSDIDDDLDELFEDQDDQNEPDTVPPSVWDEPADGDDSGDVFAEQDDQSEGDSLAAPDFDDGRDDYPAGFVGPTGGAGPDDQPTDTSEEPQP